MFNLVNCGKREEMLKKENTLTQIAGRFEPDNSFYFFIAFFFLLGFQQD